MSATFDPPSIGYIVKMFRQEYHPSASAQPARHTELESHGRHGCRPRTKNSETSLTSLRFMTLLGGCRWTTALDNGRSTVNFGSPLLMASSRRPPAPAQGVEREFFTISSAGAVGTVFAHSVNVHGLGIARS